MSSIVIVLPKIEDGKRIRDILAKRGYEIDAVCSTAAAALGEMNNLNGGIVICGYKLPEMMLQSAARRRKKERAKPKMRSAEEQHIIDRAKSLLIERNHMTESEAHRYMQKCSMDSGTNLVETAQMVLTLLTE